MNLCLITVDAPLAVGHYLESGASLKIKVELAYPLTTPGQVAAKKDLPVTPEVRQELTDA